MSLHYLNNTAAGWGSDWPMQNAPRKEEPMSQPDFPTYATVPPNVRVRWIEDYGPFDAKQVRTWAGHAYDGDYLWCDHNGAASVSENHAVKRGVTRDGTVLGFVAGTLLVACDNGRILTLPHNTVRRLP